VFTTRRYTNPRLPYLTLPYLYFIFLFSFLFFFFFFIFFDPSEKVSFYLVLKHCTESDESKSPIYIFLNFFLYWYSITKLASPFTRWHSNTLARMLHSLLVVTLSCQPSTIVTLLHCAEMRLRQMTQAGDSSSNND